MLTAGYLCFKYKCYVITHLNIKSVKYTVIYLQNNRYAVNKGINHRKLLWHGTNVAVVAAILKTGLRIMPHSGGRVGRGIYFASENNKSAGYGECP